jgi:hypothetical protein
VQAGFPPCFWVFAAPCFCVNYNTQDGENISAWSKAYNKEFNGKRIPFGCLVFFLKSGVHADHARWTPAGTPGIFAGYKLSYGYAFRGEYLVWPIDTFDEIDLRVTST